MAELKYILRNKFSQHFDTFKNTSFDKEKDEYMCNSSYSVIDFDKLTKEVYPKKQPSSYDAIFCEEDTNKVFCIEFKNQDKSDIDNKEIEKKLLNGKETLDNICIENNVSRKDYNFVYCVVYKPNKNQYKYRSRVEANQVHFGLEKYKGQYFDNIVTKDINYFTKEFSKKYTCE